MNKYKSYGHGVFVVKYITIETSYFINNSTKFPLFLVEFVIRLSCLENPYILTILQYNHIIEPLSYHSKAESPPCYPIFL